MLPVFLDHAPMSAFATPRRTVLAGAVLRDVKALTESIRLHGLLCPVVVRRPEEPNGKWVVVDGRKRLEAVRRLRFAGKLPRSVQGQGIPYVVADTAEAPNPLALLTPIERLERVRGLHGRGMEVSAIAAALYAPESYVRDVMGVSRLSERLRNAWFGGHIDLDQARAFATLPCARSQDALLQALGPFATAPDILRAIADGDTVVCLGEGEDDTLILPSRAPRDDEPFAA